MEKKEEVITSISKELKEQPIGIPKGFFNFFLKNTNFIYLGVLLSVCYIIKVGHYLRTI